MSKLPGKKIKISLTAIEDIPKNSAIPPQTPHIDLYFEDFLNLCSITYPLIHKYKLPIKRFVFYNTDTFKQSSPFSLDGSLRTIRFIGKIIDELNLIEYLVGILL